MAESDNDRRKFLETASAALAIVPMSETKAVAADALKANEKYLDMACADIE